MMAGTAPIKTLAGKLFQILITFTDVTRLRQLQDNLTSVACVLNAVLLKLGALPIESFEGVRCVCTRIMG